MPHKFIRQLIQADIREKTKAPLYWSFEMVTGGFLSQRGSNRVTE